MGTSTGSNQSTSATDEEKDMQKIQLGQMKSYAPAQTQMYNNAFGLGNQLLTSFSDTNSQQWQSLINGVSGKQSQSMINSQDKIYSSQLQSSGLYDSGTSASSRLRSAADLSNSNAQFNVGTSQNALNLALGGQAQVQGTAQTNSSQLGQQLAGLRTTSGSVNSNQGSVNLGVLGSWGYCWVAAEIFNGWTSPKTCSVRYYIGNVAPIWFRKFYLKYGERIAKFIHNKPLLRLALRPLFECFAIMGKQGMKGLVI